MLEKPSTIVSGVFGATLAMLSIAHADADSDAPPATPAASADGPSLLTLPKGRMLLAAALEINLSTGQAGKPISLSPDLWYGETDEITVGVVHSSLGATGFMGGSGDALCLTGSSNGCSDFYPGLGIDGRYRMKDPVLGFAWAAEGGLYVRNFNPFALDIKVGAVGRWEKDKIAVDVVPNLFLGLTNRSTTTGVGAAAVTTTTNGEILNLPVTGSYLVAPRIVAAVQLGLQLPFENTGDFYAIPLSIGGLYHMDDSINLSAAFSLPAIAGGSKRLNGFDARAITLGGTYAF